MHAKSIWTGVLALALFSLFSCTTTKHDAPLSVDPELEAYRQATQWPHTEPSVLITLAQIFASTGRTQEGFRHFQKLAENFPERPLLKSLEGMLQIQMASDVPVLKRVAWVEDGLAKMDAAVAKEHVPETLLRGFVEAELPSRFDRARRAIEDLDFALKDRNQLPFEAERGIHRAMAKAWTALGERDRARSALSVAGLTTVEGPALNSNQSVSAKKGYRFVMPRAVEIAPRMWVIQGYDFANVIARETDEGVVLVDTGTTVETAKAIKAVLRELTPRPIHTIILTHSHWDHAGGLSVFLEKNTQVVASAAYAEELKIVNNTPHDFSWFFGEESENDRYSVKPTRTVSREEPFRLGNLEWRLIPVAGGETKDALLIFDPKEQIAIVGDVLMPYLGAPFADEGSPDELIQTISVLRGLHAKKLIHGHDPLTRFFTVESLKGLEDASRETLSSVRELVRKGHTPAEIERELPVPASLEKEPKAVQPYLVMRNGLIQRTAQQEMGYWNRDIGSVDPSSQTELAAAIDLVGGGRPKSFSSAVDALLERGDLVLAAKIAVFGLARYPNDERLKTARKLCLTRLRQRFQNNPFKFIIYSEMAGEELPPVHVPEHKASN